MEASRVPPIPPLIANTVRSDLKTLLGESHLCPALLADAIDGVVPETIVEPCSASDLASALKISSEAGLSAIPRGSGSKIGWGNRPTAANLVLSTGRLNQVLEHAWGDMTATVEAGCVFSDLKHTLARHGQRLALDPLWPGRATIGGILATNDSGAMRARFGSLRDLVIGITLALPDDTLAKSGGKVVKNVAGYDLPKLATGSLGTLGVITQAIFRLHPVPTHARSVTIGAKDSGAVQAAVLAILDSQLVPSAIQIRASSSSTPLVDVLFEGTAAGCDAQLQQLARVVSPCVENGSDGSSWVAREPLFEESPNTAVCKISLLPSDFGRLLNRLARLAGASESFWALILQSVGVGLLRLEAASVDGLRAAVLDLRSYAESSGGALVILKCPNELKSGTDVWGSAGDALPLMRSVKAQFDPSGVLNPGRFVGSI